MNINKKAFSQDKILFEEIRVPLPVTVDLEDGSQASFNPLTVGNYLLMVKRGLEDDYDAYMGYCVMGDMKHSEKVALIQKEFSGQNVNILETIDASFYHGVQDIGVSCEKISDKDSGEVDEDGEVIFTKEVCGVMHRIPFFSLPEYALTSDSTKESLRSRIHFGVQDEHKPDGLE